MSQTTEILWTVPVLVVILKDRPNRVNMKKSIHMHKNLGGPRHTKSQGERESTERER